MPDINPVRQIARAVLGNLPHIRCFRCLSLQVGVLEKDAREAAQFGVGGIEGGGTGTYTGPRCGPSPDRQPRNPRTRIEVGKLADLIVVREKPLDDIDNVRALAMVFKGGRLVTDHRGGTDSH
jgi:hypothetical protein